METKIKTVRVVKMDRHEVDAAIKEYIENHLVPSIICTEETEVEHLMFSAAPLFPVGAALGAGFAGQQIGKVELEGARVSIFFNGGKE